MAFYLNCEAVGENVHNEVMQYSWKEWAGSTRHAEERGSWHSKVGAIGGYLQSSMQTSGNSTSYFAHVVEKVTQKVMAQEGFSCKVETVFTDAKADRIFAAVRISDLRMEDTGWGGMCHTPLSFLTAFFECPPRPCDALALPIHKNLVAEKVQTKLTGDYDVAPITAEIRALGAKKEKLFLHGMGHYVMDLPNGEEEFEVVVTPVKAGSCCA